MQKELVSFGIAFVNVEQSELSMAPRLEVKAANRVAVLNQRKVQLP